jgi:hypothetical protein
VDNKCAVGDRDVWEGKAEEEIELEEKGLLTDLSKGIVCKRIHKEPVDAKVRQIMAGM